MLLRILAEDPLVFFIIVVALAGSLALHELGHALVALWSGDDTAKTAGRVTLNPFAHLDPFGTLLLLVAGVGWARPVPVNPLKFTNYRVGLFAVSIAGIVVNLLLALGFGLLIRFLLAIDPPTITAALRGGYISGLGVVALALLYATSINISLAVFNLLPIPPLDGSKILQSVLPASFQQLLWQLERYSIVAVVLVLTVLREPITRLILWAQGVFLKLMLG